MRNSRNNRKTGSPPLEEYPLLLPILDNIHENLRNARKMFMKNESNREQGTRFNVASRLIIEREL